VISRTIDGLPCRFSARYLIDPQLFLCPFLLLNESTRTEQHVRTRARNNRKSRRESRKMCLVNDVLQGTDRLLSTIADYADYSNVLECTDYGKGGGEGKTVQAILGQNLGSYCISESTCVLTHATCAHLRIGSLMREYCTGPV